MNIKSRNPTIAAAVKAAMGAVTETAKDKGNKLSVPAVAGAKDDDIEAAMTKAVEAVPEVQNATNTETSIFQKRSFWSYLASSLNIALTVGAAALVSLNYISENTGSKITTATIGLALWAGYSAWRAGRATQPLFTPVVPHVLSK